MNIEPLVAYAAYLMKAAARTAHPTLHLCYWEGKLQCCAPKHTGKRHVVLFTFRTEDWAKGLSTTEWNQIRREISKLTKELETCLHNIKTSTKTIP